MYNVIHNLRAYSAVVTMLLVISAWYCSFAAIAEEVDPTKPFQSMQIEHKTYAKQALQLQSIIMLKHQVKAVINGQVLRTGDVISGYKIIKITNTSVQLSSAQNTISLSLFHSVTAK